MHQDFDHSVPVHEQLLKISAAKQPGHKHQHRLGPSRRARKAANRRAFEQQARAREGAKRSALIRAYWAGQVDEFPA
jgi:hypothetical protein